LAQDFGSIQLSAKTHFFVLGASIMPPDPLAHFIIRESLLQAFENVRSL
jgi:hypothetical protein